MRKLSNENPKILAKETLDINVAVFNNIEKEVKNLNVISNFLVVF